jgi:hypothetical protein
LRPGVDPQDVLQKLPDDVLDIGGDPEAAGVQELEDDLGSILLNSYGPNLQEKIITSL